MPNDLIVQGRTGRPGFPGRPGFLSRPRFPRRRFPPFFFPIIISPGPRCFRFDRFGRCCDRFGWCCDRFGRCGWEWDDGYASTPAMAPVNDGNWYGMPGYWDMMENENDMDYDED